MTLDELNDAWNELYNGAWGRGVAPIVPMSLAQEVAQAREQWRGYYKSKAAAADVTGGTAWRWVEINRALAARVRAAGGQAPSLPQTPAGVITDVAAATWSATKKAAVGIGVAAALVVTGLAVWRGSK